MSITPFENLTFTKVWTNNSDFPTVENSEAQVRADLQYHPNAILSFLNNNLIPKLTSNFNYITNSVASWFPKASASQLGAVKIGSGLNIDANGVLSLLAASEHTIGGVKIGDGLGVDANGVVSNTEAQTVRSIAHGGTGAGDAETAIGNLGIADYVVERGISGIWDFTKWNSGRVVLEVKHAQIQISNVTKIGDFWCYHWSIVPPQELLTDNPSNGQYSFRVTNGYDVGGGIQLFKTAITMYGMSSTVVTTSDYATTNLLIEGWWK